MLKKLFVTSDIHSFYEPFVEALQKAGFDSNNENHWLIICGDCFDRGPDSCKLLDYLMSLERKIIIKGNHDLLLQDLCEREFPYGYDSSNGTKKTVQDLGGFFTENHAFAECCAITWHLLKDYRSQLKNYFETKNYIFVHSWLPVIDQDWHNASDGDWEAAMWVNPFLAAKQGLNKTGKTIVFGHWHCSKGWAMNDPDNYSEFKANACWEPYQNKEQGIIGIDRCTAYTNQCNVIVLEDEFLEEIVND